MIEQNAFTYWEGDKPPYIDYCLRTIKKRTGVNVIMLDDRNYRDYIGSNLDKRFEKIKWIAQKVDCIRLAALYNHGGAWIDADTIMLKSIEHLFSMDVDFAGFKWAFNNKILNGYFFAKKHSKWLEMCLAKANKRLRDGNGKAVFYEHGGVYFGESVFMETYEHIGKQSEYKFLPLYTFLPIEFPTNRFIWSEKKDIKDFMHSSTMAIGLNHSQMSSIYSKSVQDIKKGDDLLASVFKFSETFGEV